MPMYDLWCWQCEHQWEGYAPVSSKDQQQCPQCGVYGLTRISTPRGTWLWEPHYNEQLDAWITDKRQHDRFLKENDVYEAGYRGMRNPGTWN